jgi:hypothetical protein
VTCVCLCSRMKTYRFCLKILVSVVRFRPRAPHSAMHHPSPFAFWIGQIGLQASRGWTGLPGVSLSVVRPQPSRVRVFRLPAPVWRLTSVLFDRPVTASSRTRARPGAPTPHAHSCFREACTRPVGRIERYLRQSHRPDLDQGGGEPLGGHCPARSGRIRRSGLPFGTRHGQHI